MKQYILQRTKTSKKGTIGQITDEEGNHICFTIERPQKALDTRLKGCIPTGTYDCEITYSPRFKKDLPLVKSVPNFAGIRIHCGNTMEDSEGCILVVTSITDNYGYYSKKAFDAFIASLAGNTVFKLVVTE